MSLLPCPSIAGAGESLSGVVPGGEVSGAVMHPAKQTCKGFPPPRRSPSPLPGGHRVSDLPKVTQRTNRAVSANGAAWPSPLPHPRTCLTFTPATALQTPMDVFNFTHLSPIEINGGGSCKLSVAGA